MAQDDFDVDSLAAYLHLLPAQVVRLADRGKLPGRRVSGQWRFTKAEVHHWLEQQIGLSDEDELVQMEDMLQRTALPGSDRAARLSDLLAPETISVPLLARTRSGVITDMTELAVAAGVLWDPEKMSQAVRAREELQSTALDVGVALLHPRRPLPRIISHSFVALGITPSGIPFGSERGVLTDVFFLIGAENDQAHLRILARLGRLIADSNTLEAIRRASDAVDVFQSITGWEADVE